MIFFQVCSYDRAGLGFSDRAYQVIVENTLYGSLMCAVCRILAGILMIMGMLLENVIRLSLQP